MTKQEIVKKAYVDLIGEDNYNIVKGRIVDGVCHMIEQNVLITPTLMELSLKRNDERVVAWMECTEGYFMPKSLSGIENNNGYTKIQSETDIPNEEGVYWVLRRGFNKPIYRIINDIFDADEKAYWFENYTHFIKVTRPDKLPIY